jgi:histidinol-phosphate aminotransferase
LKAISFPTSYLRPGSPTEPNFSVSQVPHKAKLDQNESPFELPREVKDAISRDLAATEWNRYPQPTEYAKIKRSFADSIGEDPDGIILTAGCDQLILLAFWAAGGPERSARIFEPAYPMFAAYAHTTQTELDRVVLGPDFDIQRQGLGNQVDLLFLVSPNNPTGDGPGRNLVLEALDRKSMIFVDEAYADYARQSSIDLVDRHPNLFVARSLSKSMLAHVRLGYGIGHPDLINVLERLIFAPYHLNAMQLAVARNFAIIKPHLSKMVTAVISERERVFDALGRLGIKTWPSKANFILFEVQNAARTYAALLDHGIRIRDVSGMPGMKEHLRVTIGTREENSLFLSTLEQYQ